MVKKFIYYLGGFMFYSGMLLCVISCIEAVHYYFYGEYGFLFVDPENLATTIGKSIISWLSISVLVFFDIIIIWFLIHFGVYLRRLTEDDVL